jgi:hypothetical protein
MGGHERHALDARVLRERSRMPTRRVEKTALSRHLQCETSQLEETIPMAIEIDEATAARVRERIERSREIRRGQKDRLQQLQERQERRIEYLRQFLKKPA